MFMFISFLTFLFKKTSITGERALAKSALAKKATGEKCTDEKNHWRKRSLAKSDGAIELEDQFLEIDFRMEARRRYRYTRFSSSQVNYTNMVFALLHRTWPFLSI